MTAQLKHLSNKIARRFYKFSDAWAAGHWHDYPLGRTPWADAKTYETLWEEEKTKTYPEIDEFEKEQGYAVDQAWMHDLALHTQVVIKGSPLCYQHGRVLYAALRACLDRAGQRKLNILETGTARGFSSVVMARALSDAGACGHITTFDILPHRTKMFWNCIDDLDGPKTRAELLEPWADLVGSGVSFIEGDSRVMVKKTALGRVDFAFLDGAHTYRDVSAEFGAIVPYQQAGDIIVFDDYSEAAFPGLVRAVDEGCKKWGYEKKVLRSHESRAYVIAKKKDP